MGESRGWPTVVQPVAAAKDPADAQRLWTLSEQLTGVQFEVARSPVDGDVAALPREVGERRQRRGRRTLGAVEQDPADPLVPQPAETRRGRVEHGPRRSARAGQDPSRRAPGRGGARATATRSTPASSPSCRAAPGVRCTRRSSTPGSARPEARRRPGGRWSPRTAPGCCARVASGRRRPGRGSPGRGTRRPGSRWSRRRTAAAPHRRRAPRPAPRNGPCRHPTSSAAARTSAPKA